MSLVKKAIQFVLLILLAFSLFACEERCYYPDEFDSYAKSVDAKPSDDGLSGSYPHQVAAWTDTDLRSSGEEFIIEIDGAWVPWLGSHMTDDLLKDTNECNICVKQVNGSSNDNCICPYQPYSEGQEKLQTTPTSEVNANCVVGDPVSENDPNICSCTTKNGTSDDWVYFFALDQKNKDESILIADKQKNCKFTKGLGLYLGLFGSRGFDIPTRVYHLYSEETSCNIKTSEPGKCVDSSGKDRTKYVFRSDNATIFLKDDGDGNNSLNTDSSNDDYHIRNEKIKIMILDSYYEDNYGKYNLNFLKGATDGSDGSGNNYGLLEFIVRLVEDSLLGEMDVNGKRQNGIIEFLFKAIVHDSGFITILQVLLSLYIAIYGVATLFGVAEISKKELTSRLLKIALVIFFTNPSSWQYYNDIVVNFFLNGTNYLTDLILSLANQSLDVSTTSRVLITQLGEDNGEMSNYSRFSYIDNTITVMLSKAAAAKIFSLFLVNPLYILIIYALIFIFILVMLYAALVYVANIMKIIFVLTLGPIFICFTLFSQTNQMFKNWIAFLGSKALEILLMFLILFSFISLININFQSMLRFTACVEDLDLQLFTIQYIKAYDVGSRGFLKWIEYFLVIGSLTYITYLALEQVPIVAGRLISISGVANKEGDAKSSLGMAKGMLFGAKGSPMSAMLNAGRAAANSTGYGLGVGGRGGLAAMRYIGRSTGLDKYANSVSKYLPSGPIAMMRNRIINSAISQAKKNAKKKGLTGKKRDEAIRKEVSQAMFDRFRPQNKFLSPQGSPLSSFMTGLDMKSVSDKLDKALIHDPLKAKLKEESKKMKDLGAKAPAPGKESQEYLKNKIMDWAKSELHIGEKDVARLLEEDKFKNMMGQKSLMDGTSAGKLAKDNPEFENKYFKALKEREEQQKAQNKKSPISQTFRGLYRSARGKDTTSQMDKFIKASAKEKELINYAERRTKLENQRMNDYLNRDRLEEMNEISKLTPKEREDYIKETQQKEKDYREKLGKELKEEKPKDIPDLAIINDNALEEAQEKLNKLNKADQTLKDDNNPEELKKLKEEYNKVGLTPTSLEVEFGASITDALLKTPDVGLKASNCLLGVADSDRKDEYKAVSQALEIEKLQLESQLKIKNLDLKMKQADLERLTKEGNEQLAAQCQKDISDLESKVTNLDRQISKVETAKSNVQNYIN